MRKTFIILAALLLLVSAGYAATVSVQKPSAQMVSATFGASSVATATVTPGANLVAFSFVCPKIMANGYLNDILYYASATSGSPTVVAELHADNNGVPALAAVQTSSDSSPTTAGWYSAGGFTSTSALTEGTQYWVVLRATAGTSATIQWVVTGGWPGGVQWGSNTAGSDVGFGMNKIIATDNGAGTWATPIAHVGGFRLSVTDGTDVAYFGVPVSAAVGDTAATQRLGINGVNNQEVGSKFTVPANVAYKVKGISMYIRKFGAATGNVRYRLYTTTDNALIDTTTVLPVGVVSTTGGWYALYFTSTATLSASTSYRVVAGNTAEDDINSVYFYTWKNTIHNDATSRTLIPLSAVSTTLSGSTWTDTATQYIPFILILDSDGEFGAQSTGGSSFGFSVN